jgi:autotransporter-associated beta strand protein
MVINGSIFNDNSRGYRVYGATGKTLTLNSALGVGSSAGSVSFTIDATSTTKVVNTAAQTWTGSTNINNGSFTLGNGGTAGTLDTGSLIILGSSGSLIINRSNAVNQGTDFSGSAVSGSGSLTQAGSGTTTLSAANTYTGGTIVNGSGTLLVNGGAVGTSSGTGTGAVTVSNTAALGGTGAISGTVAVSATSKITGGGLGTSAADALASVGTLNTGALTLASGSIFLVDIGTTTSFDKLGITGTANLGSATLSLNIATGLTFTPNQQLILIENDSADSFTGTFAGLAEGGTITSGGYTFTASYLGGTGNDFALTAVPEPSTWIGGGLILGLAAYSQRRRFRANDLSAGKRDHRDMFPQIN